MNLVWLFLFLALAGFLFAKVEPLLALPAYALLAAALKRGKTPLFHVVGVLAWIWQTYVLLAWCLVALVLTRLFSIRPGVVHHWLYYVLAFFGCLAPVSFMLSFNRDRHGPPAPESDAKDLITLSLAAGGFVAFALMPVLVTPWWWILRLLPYSK
jgi:hypothetical protein